jgi:hypothetical protein
MHLAAAKWRNASQVSWQATGVTTADSYDEGVAVAFVFWLSNTYNQLSVVLAT